MVNARAPRRVENAVYVRGCHVDRRSVRSVEYAVAQTIHVIWLAKHTGSRVAKVDADRKTPIMVIEHCAGAIRGAEFWLVGGSAGHDVSVNMVCIFGDQFAHGVITALGCRWRGERRWRRRGDRWMGRRW